MGITSHLGEVKSTLDSNRQSRSSQPLNDAILDAIEIHIGDVGEEKSKDQVSVTGITSEGSGNDQRIRGARQGALNHQSRRTNDRIV